jgi:hypothetical protein
MRKTCLAIAACAAVLSTGAAVAAPAFKIEKLNFNPIALLDDGSMVSINARYDYNSCPPAIKWCAYKLTEVSLAVWTSKENPVETPFNFLGRDFLLNHSREVISWSDVSRADYKVTDLNTGLATVFESGGTAPTATCPWPPRGFDLWWGLSDSGQLIGKPLGACGEADAVYLWSGTAAALKISPPTGYAGLRFAGINASNQFAVTAAPTTWRTGGIPKTRVLLWSPKGGYKVLPMPLISIFKGYIGPQEAVAINDSADVLGNVTKPNGERHAVLWRGNSSYDIGTIAGFKNSIAVGLTSAGQVIACAYNSFDTTYGPTGVSQLFTWENGTQKLWADAVTTSAGAPAGCSANMFVPYSIETQVLSNRAGQLILKDFSGNYLLSPIK